MKIDILIEYDPKKSEMTVRSQAAALDEMLPARIGLSHPLNEDYSFETVELIGTDWEWLKGVDKMFGQDPSRKGWTLRLVNPFERATFETYGVARLVDFYAMKTAAMIYPRSYDLRRMLPFLITYEITLRIPGYGFFDPLKKEELEKELRKKYQRVSFVS